MEREGVSLQKQELKATAHRFPHMLGRQNITLKLHVGNAKMRAPDEILEERDWLIDGEEPLRSKN